MCKAALDGCSARAFYDISAIIARWRNYLSRDMDPSQESEADQNCKKFNTIVNNNAIHKEFLVNFLWKRVSRLKWFTLSLISYFCAMHGWSPLAFWQATLTFIGFKHQNLDAICLLAPLCLLTLTRLDIRWTGYKNDWRLFCIRNGGRFIVR